MKPGVVFTNVTFGSTFRSVKISQRDGEVYVSGVTSDRRDAQVKASVLLDGSWLIGAAAK